MNLAEIKERAEKATEGPWHASSPPSVFAGIRVVAGSMPSYDAPGTPTHAEVRANAAFIAHAREDVPALVARVEELEGALANLVGDDGPLGDPCNRDGGGNCQAHFIGNPCSVAVARRVLVDVTTPCSQCNGRGYIVTNQPKWPLREVCPSCASAENRK